MSNTSSHAQVVQPLIDAMAPNLGPRTVAELRASGYSGPIHRMNLNECAFPPSPKVAEAVAEVAREVNRYPDGRWCTLGETLAKDLDVSAERMVFSGGSDVLLQAAGEITLSPEQSAIVPDPSFARYSQSIRIRGAELIAVPVTQDGRNDAAAMIAAVKDTTRLMYVASPNNPTGQMLDAGEIQRLALETPDHVLLALDEAYFEFARRAGGPDGLEIMKQRRGPWLVLRTFSKAYGLAGARIGYGICGSDEIASAFHKVRTAFNLNAFSQAAALAAYLDRAHHEALLDKMIHERERIVAGLQALGLAPLPTAGNFIAVHMPGPGADMVEALWRRGVLIGSIRTPTPGFESCIRVTVGLPEDTDAFLEALQEELESGRVYPGT